MKIEFFIQSGSKYLGILILVQALKKIALLCTNLVSTVAPRHFQPQDNLGLETTLAFFVLWPEMSRGYLVIPDYVELPWTYFRYLKASNRAKAET